MVMQQDNEQIYSRMAKKVKNQYAAMVQSPDLEILQQDHTAVYKFLHTWLKLNNVVYALVYILQVIAAKIVFASCWIMGCMSFTTHSFCIYLFICEINCDTM